MAPSTLGTFLRSFTFGHVRQLDRVAGETLRRAWRAGAGPGDDAVTIDVDSTICAVHGKQKQGAAYGYTRVLGYHPLLATRADTGEILHARLRKGSSQRGTKRFVEELIARVRRAGATGALVKPSSGVADAAVQQRLDCFSYVFASSCGDEEVSKFMVVGRDDAFNVEARVHL